METNLIVKKGPRSKKDWIDHCWKRTIYEVKIHRTGQKTWGHKMQVLGKSTRPKDRKRATHGAQLSQGVGV